jgi:hypothetical protein
MRLAHGFVLLLGATLAAAQAQTTCTVPHLPITVVDRTGRPVVGLNAASFRSEVHGAQAAIGSLVPKSDPAVVMFLDASGSMTSSNGGPNWKWFASVKAAKAVAEAAPSDAPIVLIVFSRRILQIEQGHAAVLNSLKLIESHSPTQKRQREGRTAIFDTILETAANVTPNARGQVAYLFSDGGENTSDTADRVRDTLVAANIRLFSFVLVDENPRVEEERLGPELLKDLSRETGGTAVFLRSQPWNAVGDEAKLARLQHSQIASWYELELLLPRAPGKREKWKLYVVDAHGKRRSDIEVSYPNRIVACGASD